MGVAQHASAARHRHGEAMLSSPPLYPMCTLKSAFATDSGPAPGARRRPLAIIAATMLGLAGLAIATATLAKDGNIAVHWSGTWAASPQAAGVPLEFSGQTIRQIVHASIGGTQVRVRLSNAYGASPLHIGAARVGPAQYRCVDCGRLGPGSDVRRIGIHDDPGRRPGNQRPGRSPGARPSRSGHQPLDSREPVRGDRTYAGVADDVCLAGG